MSKAGDDEIQAKRNHLISRKKFRQFMETHPGSQKDKTIFDHWCKSVEQACWMKHSDVTATFGSADRVGRRVVFDVGGNKYRVVADIKYRKSKPAWVYVKHVLTHKEYDEDQWKKTP